MKIARAALSFAAAVLASSTLAAPFDDLAAKAQRVEALEPFLARYLAHCTDPYERAACERNVAAARKAVQGKAFAVRVTDAAPLVRTSFEGEKFVLLLTPFVDGGGGYALTHGAPAKQDAAGHPVVALIPIRGKLPPGTLEMEFQGPFRTGAVELEIVFIPEKAWKLKGKGASSSEVEGLGARFLGVRVLDARTGKEIASRTL